MSAGGPMNQSENKLPEKLSDLLQVALEDLRKAEASDQYAVNMRDWHLPFRRVCSVCLAGSVMAFSLDADITKNLAPVDFDDHTSRRLSALDSLRRGAVDDAACQLWIESDYSHLDRDVPRYSNNPKQWHKDMEKLVKDLKEAGL